MQHYEKAFASIFIFDPEQSRNSGFKNPVEPSLDKPQAEQEGIFSRRHTYENNLLTAFISELAMV